MINGLVYAVSLLVPVIHIIIVLLSEAE